ncbi:hypothetical protein K491DRAFT_714901 [Lophiostoma macrostomum CBS 122681]|uniref:Uncharacterized protein n=1 Tax=Lophiostoma macrostomum CBS 122681 TaxID=1314788 RepID=A0A6A6TDP3_9PLEO|nr:hypothetical protein K491DRAFT_714901 [Lophiostoma macrostomum CBS 122681]
MDEAGDDSGHEWLTSRYMKEMLLEQLPFSPDKKEEIAMIKELVCFLEEYSYGEKYRDLETTAKWEGKIRSILEKSEFLRGLGAEGVNRIFRHIGFVGVFWDRPDILGQNLASDLEKLDCDRDRLASAVFERCERQCYRLPKRLLHRMDDGEAATTLEVFIIDRALEGVDPGFWEKDVQAKIPEFQAYKQQTGTVPVLERKKVISHLRWVVYEWYRANLVGGVSSEHAICPRMQKLDKSKIQRLSKKLYELDCESNATS